MLSLSADPLVTVPLGGPVRKLLVRRGDLGFACGNSNMASKVDSLSRDPMLLGGPVRKLLVRRSDLDFGDPKGGTPSRLGRRARLPNTEGGLGSRADDDDWSKNGRWGGCLHRRYRRWDCRGCFNSQDMIFLLVNRLPAVPAALRYLPAAPRAAPARAALNDTVVPDAGSTLLRRPCSKDKFAKPRCLEDLEDVRKVQMPSSLSAAWRAVEDVVQQQHFQGSEDPAICLRKVAKPLDGFYDGQGVKAVILCGTKQGKLASICPVPNQKA
ncbi:MAG: hypothetical protein FRX49_05810 [Trebouxia sp. A1-2]|nr:MAG: hypothetical protein FRX49_05810 [Trebouxia sp. A1-2]